MSIIELGEISDESASASPVRTSRVVGRPMRSAAVLLLALGLLAGSTPPSRRMMSAVPAWAGSSAYLAEGSVFVIDPPRPDHDRYLTAYAQPASNGVGLRRQWRSPLPREGDYVDVRVERGLVLAAGLDAGSDVLGTTAFDAGTGQQRWRHLGTPAPIADGGLLLTNIRQNGSDRMSRIDPDTGRVLWSVPLLSPSGPSFHLTPDRRVDRFVLVQPTGEVQVYDATTGGLLRSVDTLPGDRKASPRAQVVGDLLVILPADEAPMVGYGLAGLDRRWTAEVPPVSFVAGCADLLCVSYQDGTLRVLDPATGVVRWSGPGDESLVDVRGDRLLMSGPGERWTARDAATGRTGAELGDWDLVPVLRRDDPLIGMRRGDDGRMLVAELDLAAGRPRILDLLPNVAGSCQASLPVLLCQRLDGSVTLWRLQP